MCIKRLIVFGTGFLANNYILSLIERSERDVVVKVVYNHHRIDSMASDLEQISMDSDQLLCFIESFKPSHVLCLHGNSFVPESSEVRTSLEQNTMKIMEFLELITKSKARKYLEKILVIGSASEYGKCYNEAIKEDFPLHATSLYGLSKICLYQASMYYYHQGLPVVHIRQFNTVGPTQRECFVLPAFCKQIAEVEKRIRAPELVVGDLSQERDFLDVNDTCDAYSLLLEKGKPGEAYNVSSGKFIAIRQLLDCVLDMSKVKKEVLIKQKKHLFYKENSLSCRLHADISKIKVLGFEPKVPLQQTVKNTLAYWRKHV